MNLSLQQIEGYMIENGNARKAFAAIFNMNHDARIFYAHLSIPHFFP
jgi:hypothetical protein